MYAASAWQRLDQARFIDWPKHRGENTISGIAKRVIAESGIVDGDIIIGSSLGGIVGCEIANQIQIAKLVLVGSAKNKEEISNLLTLLHPLAQLAPLDFIRLSAGKIPGELSQMFSSSESSFMRAMCSAIFHWEGLYLDRVNAFRIHGTNDRVIPMPEQVDHSIEAGHLIAMTHPEECVKFIRSHLAQ